MNNATKSKSKSKYAEQYKDPRWQKKRLEILNLCNWRCGNCGDGTNPLHVHHLYYVPERMIWDYPNFALTSLCDSCHSDQHDPEHPINQSKFNKHYFEILSKLFLQTDCEPSWLENVEGEVLEQRCQHVFGAAVDLSLRLDCGLQSAIQVLSSLPHEESRTIFLNSVCHEDFWNISAKLKQRNNQ